MIGAAYVPKKPTTTNLQNDERNSNVDIGLELIYTMSGGN
jgi:hypothetical protein